MANIHDLIGNYRVLADLGEGSFGRVYKAQHTFFTNRIVAIKLMRAVPLNSAQERDQFLQEGHFLEALKHSYILTVIDVGIHEGFPYLVTEYAPSGSLRDRLTRQMGTPLPIREALTILSQTAEALQYAHQRNIVHRDLKPENILFTAGGDVLLADFGLATTLASTSIRQGTVVGTPAYMAPEQFHGVVSKESDQYALGCIAYELFTGSKPFTAPNVLALAWKHATEEPISPRVLNPALPAHAEHAILKAMAKLRTDRYGDVSEFITALSAPLPQPSAQAPVVIRHNGEQQVTEVYTHDKGVGLLLTAAYKTDVGKQREQNEDNVFYKIAKDADRGLFLIADGMGGETGREVSRLVIETISNALDSLLKPLPDFLKIGKLSEALTSQAAEDKLTVAYYLANRAIETQFVAAVQQAHEAILHYGEQHNSAHGLGSTVTGLLIYNGNAYIPNVGNSRTYLLRNGILLPLSKDHSLVARLVETKRIEPEDVYTHPQRKVIYRMLGVGHKTADADIFHDTLKPGDIFLLCSDGLWQMVQDQDLLKILNAKRSPQQKCDALIDMANENGGLDNISAIVVHVNTL